MSKTKGRSAGVPNYKNDLLVNVIEAILPDGPLQWRTVATRYKEASGEADERDPHDLKRHFTTSKNMCDNGKKKTGSSAPKPTVARCQEIWRKMLAKSSATNCGGNPSDSETSDSDKEIEDSTQFEEDDANDAFDSAPIDSQYDEQERFEKTNYDEGNELPDPFSAPPPRHQIPRVAATAPIIPVRAPSPLAGQRNPSPAPGQKKRGIAESEDVGKSKNSRSAYQSCKRLYTASNAECE